MIIVLKNQSKQETARLPGLVGVSPGTLRLGSTLNTARTRFKEAMGEYRKLFGDSIEAIEQTSDDLRESLLGGLKIQHIHFVHLLYFCSLLLHDRHHRCRFLTPLALKLWGSAHSWHSS